MEFTIKCVQSISFKAKCEIRSVLWLRKGPIRFLSFAAAPYTERVKRNANSNAGPPKAMQKQNESAESAPSRIHTLQIHSKKFEGFFGHKPGQGPVRYSFPWRVCAWYGGAWDQMMG